MLVLCRVNVAGLGECGFDELAQRFLRKRTFDTCLVRDRIEVDNDVIVDLIKEQQIAALGSEIFAQFFFQDHIEYGHFRQRAATGRRAWRCQQVAKVIVEDEPVGDDGGCFAIHGNPGIVGKRASNLNIVAEGPLGNRHVQFGCQLLAEIRIGFVGIGSEQLHAFVGKAGA